VPQSLTALAPWLEAKIRRIDGEPTPLLLVGPVQLPIAVAEDTAVFQWYVWAALDVEPRVETLLPALWQDGWARRQQSSLLVYGPFAEADEALVRLHSTCHTGDIFGSRRCDCGFQLHRSLRLIVDHGAGALVYLADQEGRGIGLMAKALTYLAQEQGLDTLEANEVLGFPTDARRYDEAIRVLRHLRRKPVAVITNNPAKLTALEAAGMAVSRRVSLWGGVTEYNVRYLRTKVDRAGHLPTDQPWPTTDEQDG
jgi:GTP cyclohydrolase II